MEGATLSVFASTSGLDAIGAEPRAFFGVDVQPPRCTPAGEPIRVEVDLEHPDQALFDVANNLFGPLEPRVGGGTRFIGIGAALPEGRA